MVANESVSPAVTNYKFQSNLLMGNELCMTGNYLIYKTKINHTIKVQECQIWVLGKIEQLKCADKMSFQSANSIEGLSACPNLVIASMV